MKNFNIKSEKTENFSWYHITVRFDAGDNVDTKKLLRKLRNGKNSIASMSSRWWFSRFVTAGFAVLFSYGGCNVIHIYIKTQRNIVSFVKHLQIRVHRIVKITPQCHWELIIGPKNDLETCDIIDNLLEVDGDDVPTAIKRYNFGGF